MIKAKDFILVDPIRLILFCPQCKMIIGEYAADYVVQNSFDDEIIHKADSFNFRKHTPILMMSVKI